VTGTATKFLEQSLKPLAFEQSAIGLANGSVYETLRKYRVQTFHDCPCYRGSSGSLLSIPIWTLCDRHFNQASWVAWIFAYEEPLFEWTAIEIATEALGSGILRFPKISFEQFAIEVETNSLWSSS
jgi:hypothetical protein